MNKPSPSRAAMQYKRPRNYNFTIAEKMHFLDCLQEYIDVTENRRLDTSAVIQKKRTWELLVSRYNEMFPNGPQRNYAQLKDLYRRMKILARKVYKQRSGAMESIETPISADEPTERLIQMMFSVNSIAPSDYLDLELRESDDVDMKPFVAPDVDVKPILDADTNATNSTVSGDSAADSSRAVSDSDGSVEYRIETTGGRTARKSRKPTMIWTANGEVKLPTDIVVTEMPLETEPNTSDRFSAENLKRRLSKRPCTTTAERGISSDELNLELLELARREHKMKMKVHEASLEVLALQKKKLLKELEHM